MDPVAIVSALDSIIAQASRLKAAIEQEAKPTPEQIRTALETQRDKLIIQAGHCKDPDTRKALIHDAGELARQIGAIKV